MRAAYDVETVQAAERPLLESLPEGTLMQRAAAALARRCAELLGRVYGARVVLLVGKGDNGGDALFAGARLARRGARVDALLVAGAGHERGLAALRAASGRVHDPRDAEELVRRADLVVDGILGIGGSGGLRDDAARLAVLCTQAAVPVVAVDVPSGVDASTGRVDGVAVRADVTVTFGALKAGLVISPGAQCSGRVEVADIGLTLPEPRITLLDADDVAGMWPAAEGEATKYTRGVLGLVAGSDTYTGAAVLAAGGAVHGAAGMVRFVSTERPAMLVRQRWPEVVVTVVEPGAGKTVLDAGRVQAWVVGSGLGTDDAAAAVLESVLGTDLPVLVDADGVTLLADRLDVLRGRAAPTLLTPHAGEFARLVGAERDEVEADRLAHVTRAAADLGATILLKGTTTLVADLHGQVRVNPTGTPWLATAGSGDVLSGLAGSLLAAGLDPLDAGSAAAFLHGLAALLAGGPVSAYDVVRHLPEAVRAVRSSV
jgi:hydroxyethylthiazole kinase-like uncharacterized protein yjeF